MSPMNRRKVPLLVAVALLLAGSALVVLRSGPGASSTEASSRSSAARGAQAPGAGPTGASPTGASALETGRGPRRQAADMASYLREKYGPHITDPYMQLKMLEELMRHFQQLNPEGWKEDLLALLREVFPGLYDELAARLEQRVEYARWMEREGSALRAMKDPKEARAALWEERHRLFGKEVAERIWQAEIRHQAESDALEAIDARPRATVAERLGQYKQSLKDIYGEHADAYLESRQQEVMNRFLELGTVQTDLGGLPPEQRAESLRHIRAEMGLDEAALARWEELDARRDARWEVGGQDMAEREARARQYAGPELEARLVELRARYFDAEADIIATEEQGGFFRFTLPRVWGRN
jgi:hypothetical protein